MRIRTSELLLAGALVELAAFALHVAVLFLGVAVWIAVTCTRFVLWPVLRWLGRDVANAARRVWGEPLPMPRPRTWASPWYRTAVFSPSGVRWARRNIPGLPGPASNG
jgi:hypothetical protein